MARLRRSVARLWSPVDIIRDAPDKWYPPEAVADHLGVPINCLAEGIQSGQCFAVKFGGPAGYRVQLQEVQRWMRTLGVGTGAET